MKRWLSGCACLLLLATCGAMPEPRLATHALSTIQSRTVAPIAPPLPTTATDTSIATRMDRFLTQLTDLHKFSGTVLVAREGRILLHEGYGFADRERQLPNTPETKFLIASITKPFTAVAIMLLAAHGELKVQDHVCQYLVDCPDAWRDITLHHLLSHTSGIPNYSAFPDYAARQATPSTPLETITRFKDKPLDFRPGERWSYSNSGYILLGVVIERASGQSYEAFLRDAILRPLGMQDTGYNNKLVTLATRYVDASRPAAYVDPSIPYAAGALYSTVDDLYRFDQVLYGAALLPQPFRDQLFAPAADVPIPGTQYAYGWFIKQVNGRRMIWHNGHGHGIHTYLARFPDDQAAIVVLSNQMDTDVGVIVRRLARMLFGEEVWPPHAVADKAAKDIAISDQLQREGVKFETARVVLWIEKSELTQAEVEEFGALVTQGIIDIEKFLGVEYDEKIEYFVSSMVKIDHVRPAHASPTGKPFVYLSFDAVKDVVLERNNPLPYLHEATHVITLVGPRAMWLSEGLADYVATAVREQYDGYNFPEKKDVVKLAKEILASEVGKKVLPQVGLNKLPIEMSEEERRIFLSIRQDRKMREAVHKLSESFVKFLVESVGIQEMIAVIRAQDTEAAMRAETGRTTEEWKTAWLNSLGNK